MWESVLRISAFPHAPSSSVSHLAGELRVASSVSLLFAFHERGGLAPQYEMRGDVARSRWRLSRAAMAPIALTSRLSALPLCFSASLASLGYAATATRPGGANGVWSRHIAYRMRVRRRANATIAIRRPRRAPSV